VTLLKKPEIRNQNPLECGSLLPCAFQIRRDAQCRMGFLTKAVSTFCLAGGEALGVRKLACAFFECSMNPLNSKQVRPKGGSKLPHSKAPSGRDRTTMRHWTSLRCSRLRREQKLCSIRQDGSAPGPFGLASGFTLLEVLVSLTVLAVGAALALSLISGSLGNIRKVQKKARTVEHAEAVMELALLNNSILQPTTFAGDFEDGTRWSVRVENYTLPGTERLSPGSPPQNMPVKLLRYTVEMFSPDSRATDYQLQTLKLVRTTPEDQRTRLQQ
jgi:prepilin-type N-terminal cleavage/methylation domain-containing protein